MAHQPVTLVQGEQCYLFKRRNSACCPQPAPTSLPTQPLPQQEARILGPIFWNGSGGSSFTSSVATTPWSKGSVGEHKALSALVARSLEPTWGQGKWLATEDLPARFSGAPSTLNTAPGREAAAAEGKKQTGALLVPAHSCLRLLLPASVPVGLPLGPRRAALASVDAPQKPGATGGRNLTRAWPVPPLIFLAL